MSPFLSCSLTTPYMCVCVCSLVFERVENRCIGQALMRSKLQFDIIKCILREDFYSVRLSLFFCLFSLMLLSRMNIHLIFYLLWVCTAAHHIAYVDVSVSVVCALCVCVCLVNGDWRWWLTIVLTKLTCNGCSCGLRPSRQTQNWWHYVVVFHKFHIFVFKMFEIFYLIMFDDKKKGRLHAWWLPYTATSSNLNHGKAVCSDARNNNNNHHRNYFGGKYRNASREYRRNPLFDPWIIPKS